MKAIISNKIYMTVEPSLYRALDKELTYHIPSYNEPEKFAQIKNLKVINYNIAGGKMLIAFPVGRVDLIPKGFEIVDKRATNYIEDFPKFKFDLRPSQQEIHDELEDNCMINAKVGYGKAQPAGSLVRVAGGWKPIEAIEVGESVITASGNTSRVLGKFYHKDKPIYKITFADGRYVEACGEHLWGTINSGNKYRVLTTTEILNNNFFKTRKLYVPLCKPIEDKGNTSLPLHPYVLGVILGDGCIAQKSVVISSADIEIVNRVESFLPEGHTIKKLPSAKYEYSVTTTVGKVNGVTNTLRQLGLQGSDSFTKFIPEVYKFTSLENKLLLLQGLFDTDGTVNKGNGIEYYTISPELASGVAEIVRSLGGMCSIGIKKSPKYTYKGEVRYGRDCYVLCVQRLPLYLKKQLFSLPRKLDRISAGQYDNSGKLRIDSIEYVGHKDCWCISIDSEDKLYLTDEYIVTHNTFTGLAIAAKLKQKTLIVVHTVALRNQWEKEVVKTLGIKPGVIGSGKFNIDSPVVVANTQSLIKHVSAIGREFGLVILDECLDYTSKITTRDGPVAIGKIVNNELYPEVLSYNEYSGKLEWKNVVRHFKNKQEEDMIKFTFSNQSTLVCTMNHTIYSLNKGKTKAENLLEGDWVRAHKSSSTLNEKALPVKSSEELELTTIDNQNEELTALEIVSVDFVKATGGYRYNIEVEDNHNYFSGGKLVSNCHHVSSPTFGKIIDGMFSRYKIGLSGTIERKDQKHVVFKDYFGSKIFKPAKENTMKPKVHVYDPGIGFSDYQGGSWADKVTALSESYLYRDLVVALADNYSAQGHSVLVVSQRVDLLKHGHSKSKSTSELLIGEVKDSADRDIIIENIYNKVSDQLWATQSLASEGLSINPLSCIILAEPLNNMPLLEQLIGRIVREHPDKPQPIIVDIKLTGNTVTRQFNNRLGHYMKEGYSIEFIK